MRIRITTAALVLGLGIVGITVAQQIGEQPKPSLAPARNSNQKGPRTDKAELRGQVARLRAEMEMLELEHEVDRSILSDALKGQWLADSDSEQDAKARTAITNVKKLVLSAGQFAEFTEKFGEGESLVAQAKEELKKEAVNLRAENDRKKKAFVEQTTKLNEQRMELAEVEKRYNEAR